MLTRFSWSVVDKNGLNWNLGPGLAVREYLTDAGPTDYALFVGWELRSLRAGFSIPANKPG